jgi:hypothetical protein
MSVTSVSRSTPTMSALRADPAQRVAEPRAAGVEVEGARPRDAQLVGDLRADARDRVLEAGAGQHHQVDLVGCQAAGGQRLAARGGRHLDEGLVDVGPAPLGDPDAGADPLVAGVHHPRQLVVGDPPSRPVAADAQDPGAWCAVAQLDRAHSATSG